MYHTCAASEPLPFSLGEYTVVDTDGSCSPRFMRMSLNNIPNNKELLTTSKMPVAVAVTAMAGKPEGEAAVPVVDCGEQGPLRCSNCRAYLNVFCRFAMANPSSASGSTVWICNLCGTKNPVPESYECGIDSNGIRFDRQERPELWNGSVDFVAGKDMLTGNDRDPNYLFVLDVSHTAVTNGLMHVAINAIRQVVTQSLAADPKRIRLGLMAYSTELFFFDLTSESKEPHMITVADIGSTASGLESQAFCPLPRDAMMPPIADSSECLLALLDTLPTLFTRDGEAQACTGCAAAFALECLSQSGGKVLLFQSALGNVGNGGLKDRTQGNAKLYGTDKEALLFRPVEGDKFYEGLATKFALHMVSLDLFVCGRAFCDTPTLSKISSQSGGSVHFFRNFKGHLQADAMRLGTTILRTCMEQVALESVMKMRCCKGLEIESCFGNFYMAGPPGSEVYFANCTPTNTVVYHLKHSSSKGLPPGQPGYLQSAILYTDRQGNRRIRVHNTQFSVTDKLVSVFAKADLEVVLLSIIRQTCSALETSALGMVRENVKQACVALLREYRQRCSGCTNKAQLILPESLKLLPVYVSSLLKSALLRANDRVKSSADRVPVMGLLHVSADKRAAAIQHYTQVSAPVVLGSLYPQIFDLTDLDSAVGTVVKNPSAPNQPGRFKWPKRVWASSTQFRAKRMYLIDNTRVLWLWVGAEVPKATLESLFVSRGQPPNAQLALSPKALQLWAIVNRVIRLRSSIGVNLHLQVIRAGGPHEVELQSILIEDKIGKDKSYGDWLCEIHQKASV